MAIRPTIRTVNVPHGASGLRQPETLRAALSSCRQVCPAQLREAPVPEGRRLDPVARHCSNLLFSKLENHVQVRVIRGPNATPFTIVPPLEGGSANARSSNPTSHMSSV